MSAQVSYNMATKQVRYEALVKALHGDLFRYAYWLCHDKHVAEDLVQETFLRAWRALVFLWNLTCRMTEAFPVMKQ